MKQSARVPTSTIALRIAAVMHRRPGTPWNIKKEIEPFRKLAKYIQEEDLVLVERYYRSNWPPRVNVNHLRHDLATVINNWQGECDKARIWCDAHPIKVSIRKIIPLPSLPETDTDVSPEEVEMARATFRKLMGRDPNFRPKTTQHSP